MKESKSDLPLISVVLCTYNGERFLQKQLRSIEEQTYPNLEVIISDDASADGTKVILSKYEKCAGFKVFYQAENLGYIKNFAFALNKANGAFIALCDQDDVWLPHKIETLFQYFGNEWLVYSDSLLVNENGESLGKKLSSIRNMYSGRETKGFFLFNVVWGHALMMRRELLSAALPIPEDIPHDIWLAYKAATITGIKYCDQVLTHYRQHQNTYTQTLLPKYVQTRTLSKRFEYYLKQLYWIGVLKKHAQPAEQQFYNTLHEFFLQKEKGSFSYPLFFFLLKHQLSLFRFSKKNFISRLIYIRKLARGERQQIS
jgi:glycosyltransferase involved in cell wall biosynthesis